MSHSKSQILDKVEKDFPEINTLAYSVGSFVKKKKVL